jgi:PAS domain S-box-containing protein
LTRKGIITEVNDKWCQVLNYKREEVIGKSIFKFIPLDEREKAKASFKRKIQSKKTYSKPNLRSYLTKEGNNKKLMINDFFSFDENNNIKSVHTTMEDITRLVEAEAKIKEAHELLQVANKELDKKVKERTEKIEKLLKHKDEFISQLGHDLKTPLSVILNILPLIKETVTDKEVIKDCDIAIRNTDYIKNLVTETLSIARLTSPNVRFKMEDIQLFDMLKDISENKPFLLEDKKIKFENNISKNLKIFGDKLRLEELFNNLISNSAKFTPDNGIIRFNAKKSKDFVTISISDSGIGLSKDQIEHVFDEFYKVDVSRHDINSCGLGLSIAKRIVEKHGGKIWAESKGVGKGTTISFTLKNSK